MEKPFDSIVNGVRGCFSLLSGGGSVPEHESAKAFLGSFEPVRHAIGLLMFEFSRFWPTDYEHGRDFIADLDKFLGQLPTGWPHVVEMPNRNWLKPEYFECLARHRVAHVFNSWDAMPPVGEQMALPGSRTNPELVAARFLLKPGRKYEQAVKAFEPYDSIKPSGLLLIFGRVMWSRRSARTT